MTSSVTPTPTGATAPLLRLFHGTDLASAQDILQRGLDATHAAAWNGSGEFWATTEPTDADVFAQVNPAGGVPARFECDVPAEVVHRLLLANPPQAYQHGTGIYEFLPACFATLNQHMTNRRVTTPVP